MGHEFLAIAMLSMLRAETKSLEKAVDCRGVAGTHVAEALSIRARPESLVPLVPLPKQYVLELPSTTLPALFPAKPNFLPSGIPYKKGRIFAGADNAAGSTGAFI